MHKDKRLAFSFMENYYQVYKRLSDKQKVIFMDTLLEIQFLEKRIDDVKFDNSMTDMAFHSILHHLQSTVDGYLVQARKNDMFIGVHIGGTIGGTIQVEVEEQVEVQVQYVKAANGINQELWNEWQDYRREIKKPLTDKGISIQLKLLCDNIDEHEEIINNSIQNGWTGLFAPKKQSTYKGKSPQVGSIAWQYEQEAKAKEGIIDV